MDTQDVQTQEETTESEATILWKQLVAAEYLKNETKFESLTKQSENLKLQGQQLVSLIDTQKQTCDDLGNEIDRMKTTELNSIRDTYNQLQNDYKQLEKDVNVKQSTFQQV